MNKLIKHNKGQILPLILFCLVVAAVMLVVMFNTTQKVTDKTVATNAADAAAYSGGVWAARQLNFMAYTNRAMIANHVGVGHMVAYVSWIRYVEDSTDKLEKLAGYLPYIGPAIKVIDKYAVLAKKAAETAAKGFIPVLDALNATYSLAQAQAFTDLRPGQVDGVMHAVVTAYDPVLLLNNTSELTGSAGSHYKTLIDASILRYKAALLGAVEITRPGRDGQEMYKMVEKSYAGSERWLRNRNWRINILGVVKIRKESTNNHTLNGQLSRWESTDKLRLGIWTGTKFKWSTLGKGKANSQKFHKNYKGIHSYARKRGRADKELYFDLVALATKRDIQTVPDTRMGIEGKNTPISGYSKARVYFERPPTGFSGTFTEYANLYNPFWKVKLVEPW